MATRKQDAKSILLEDDQELAEELERRTHKLTGKSVTTGKLALIIKATELGDFLRKTREDKKLSIEDIAGDFPITASTIGAIELGEIATPSEPVLAAFSKSLSVSVKKLRGMLGKDQVPSKTVAKAELMVERMFSGATSFADAEAFAEAQDLQDQVWTNFDMFMMVVDNILFAFDEDFDKVAAIKQAVSDFGSRVAALKANLTDAVLFQPIIKAQGDIIMSQGTEKPTPAADPSAALKAAIDGALANTALDRAGKAAAAQAAFETYAEAVKAQLDAVAPPDPAETVVKALTPLLAPLVEQLSLLTAKLGVPPQPQQVQPQQKSFVPGQPVVNDPGQAALPVSPETGKPSPLTQMIRKSVGLSV